jgi:hypothetical protein
MPRNPNESTFMNTASGASEKWGGGGEVDGGVIAKKIILEYRRRQAFGLIEVCLKVG